MCPARLLFPVLLLAITAPMGVAGNPAEPSLESLLAAHRRPLQLDGSEATGPGFDLMVDSATDAQFFLIAEEHNLRELNQLTVALFDALQARFGFRHLVLEQGSIIADWLDRAARGGGREAVDALVRTYPHAPTFATDEELELITHVSTRSAATGASVWGVDQELAAMHLLERLAGLTSVAETRADLLRLAAEARPHEKTRTGDTHYLYSVADPAEYEALASRPGIAQSAEARTLLDALQRTVDIYTRRRTPDGIYESGRTREMSMRARFMEHYRAALEGTGPARAIVKMGHWHILRGIYRADVPTFGNFLSEFAAANGMNSVVVATFVIEGPEPWRNSAGAFAAVGDPDGISVVDLRPLRPLAHTNRIANLSEGWRDLIFQADLLLIIGGGRTGSYRVAYGES